jgi:DinB superfamily
MKTTRQLAALEPMVLGRVRGVSGDDWHAAPAGRWSLAQILHHLAVGLDEVTLKLEERKDRTNLRRRASPKQQLLRHLVLGVGRIPRGREAKVAIPDARPDPELATAQFRMAVERLTQLSTTIPQERKTSVFVRHPVFGDLNLPEWVRFFFVHTRHHAHQIDVRLRWLHRKKGS